MNPKKLSSSSSQRRKIFSTSTRAALASCLVSGLALVPLSLQAASVTWDGDAMNGVFSDSDNWAGDTYPGLDYGVLGNGDTATSSLNNNIGGMHVTNGNLEVDANTLTLTDGTVDFLVGTLGSGTAGLTINNADVYASSSAGFYMADHECPVITTTVSTG